MSENTIYKSYAVAKGVSQYGLDNKRLDYEALSNLIGGCVLCNEIVNVDDCLELVNGCDKVYYDKEGNEITEEQANEMDYDEYEEEYIDIYQYYIVSDISWLEKANEIVYYSPLLDVYVWGVTHFGTSWSYVLTNIAIIE